MNTLTTFYGGPEGDAVALLRMFSDESKSLTLKEAMAGSRMNWRRAKNALQILLEYRGPLLTVEPCQRVEQDGDGTAYRITMLAKEYLAWKETEIEIGVFDNRQAKLSCAGYQG